MMLTNYIIDTNVQINSDCNFFCFAFILYKTDLTKNIDSRLID